MIKMIQEIRIYYESLEQAAHYIKPILERGIADLKLSVNISLIKLASNNYSKRIAPIIFWKNPDILLTIIMGNIEYPLLLIEFSNAVFTEDHELQRFDGLVAAAKNNCIYAKISPIFKQSQSEHGGNIDFDYLGPFSLIFKKLNKLFFHFNWECDSKGVVKVDKNYLSCPQDSTDLTLFINLLLNFIKSNSFNESDWIIEFQQYVLKEEIFHKWKDKLEKVKLPDITLLNSSRTEWIDSRKEFILKLNRFGHAMDPERGMLAYYGTLYDNTLSKMMFDEKNNAWYKDTSKEKEIDNYLLTKGLKKSYDYLYCFSLGSGLSSNETFNKIITKYSSINSELIELNLTKFLKDNYLSLNKSLRTIFKYSICFYIVDTNNKVKVKFIWDKIANKEDYSNLPNKVAITPKGYFDEDDITYITIHNILKSNNHIILGASYPGAQADRAILIDPGTGRKQERRYIDVISYLPNEYTSLQENKGQFVPSQIQGDITELSKYKTDDKYKKAIKTFIERFDKNAPHTIKIGVGFWANVKFTVSKLQDLDLMNLDYFVYVTNDRKKWFIWSTGNHNIFKITKGDISMPSTFEITSQPKIDKSLKDYFFCFLNWLGLFN